MIKSLLKDYAETHQAEIQDIGAFGVAILRGAALVSWATAGAVAIHMIDRYQCRSAFAAAHAVTADRDVSVTSSLVSEDQQGHPECRATGVDKNGKPVTFIRNNNGKPPRAAGLAFRP